GLAHDRRPAGLARCPAEGQTPQRGPPAAAPGGGAEQAGVRAVAAGQVEGSLAPRSAGAGPPAVAAGPPASPGGAERVQPCRPAPGPGPARPRRTVPPAGPEVAGRGGGQEAPLLRRQPEQPGLAVPGPGGLPQGTTPARARPPAARGGAGPQAPLLRSQPEQP